MHTRLFTRSGLRRIFAFIAFICLLPVAPAFGDAPLLEVLKVHVTDVDGDHDAFADAGETARMSLVVRNNASIDLTDVRLLLATSDTDIPCISKAEIDIARIAAGAVLDTAALGSPAGQFEFEISAATTTLDAADPARARFTLAQCAGPACAPAGATAIVILLDLDIAGGALPPPLAGPDGVPGTADDGILFDGFDVDRDGNGAVDLSDGRPGVPNDTIGYTVGTASGGTESLAGIACGGFPVPPQDPNCRIDPDNDMDWHVHCPAGTCPPPHVVGSTTLGFVTPAGGALAYSGQNSLHWGRHNDPANRLKDTTGMRQIAAFATRPINLTPLPERGEPILSFFHIADLMDNNELNVPSGQAADYASVQIRVDRNADPALDDWGPWDRLVPFENTYDHIPYVWSTFGAGGSYCTFTPADTGMAPPAPRGVHETMCFPQGVFSHCGSAWSRTTTYQCPGPGAAGATEPASGALWVRSRVALGAFLGRRVQIRWIGQGWEFDSCEDYPTCGDIGYGWYSSTNEDGWWVDDIAVTGALSAPAPLLPDARPAAPGTCPARACDPTQGQNGFNVVLETSDADGDGVVAAGETLTLSAAGTTNPGGCFGGSVQFRFGRDGSVIRDWSIEPAFTDRPVTDATYFAQARCDRQPSCTSAETAPGAVVKVLVYPGDGTDIVLSLEHDSGITTVYWSSRPQVNTVHGYDLYRGTIAAIGAPNLYSLSGIACYAADIPQPAGAPGPRVSLIDGDIPAARQAHYYLAGHNPAAAGAVAALGRRSDGTLRPPPPPCP